ncbi:MAG TPA: hypothetical protein VNY05_13505 [Candidatus Acidoferrales bacterium]|nr:hypothetical protein [Candidatus Acidoferrales bacterium]
MPNSNGLQGRPSRIGSAFNRKPSRYSLVLAYEQLLILIVDEALAVGDAVFANLIRD